MAIPDIIIIMAVIASITPAKEMRNNSGFLVIRQAHYDRNQALNVRLEPLGRARKRQVEGMNQHYPESYPC